MPHATLRIRIPIEKEDEDEKTPLFSYVPAHLEDIRPGVYVYILKNRVYEAYKVNTEIHLFTKTPGIITTFMFGVRDDPLQRVGMIEDRTNTVQIYDDCDYIFVTLYKKTYHF